MNTLELILASRVRTPSIGFGLHEPVKFLSLDAADRKKDGLTTDKFCFMTFVKVDKDNKITHKKEFSLWRIRPGKYVGKSFASVVGKMQHALAFYNPGFTFNPAKGVENKEAFVKLISTEKGCKELNASLIEQFAEGLEGKLGMDSAPIRIKVVVNKDGEFPDFPGEVTFFEPLDKSLLKITTTEQRNFDEGKKPKEKDDLPKAEISDDNTVDLEA